MVSCAREGCDRLGRPPALSGAAKHVGALALPRARGVPSLPTASAVVLQRMQQPQDALSGPRSSSLPPAVPSLVPPHVMPSSEWTVLDATSAQSGPCQLVNSGRFVHIANNLCTHQKQVPLPTQHCVAQPISRANRLSLPPQNVVRRVGAPTLSQQTSLELRPGSRASLGQVRPAEYMLSRPLVAQPALPEMATRHVVSTPTFSIVSGACGSLSSVAQVLDGQAALPEANPELEEEGVNAADDLEVQNQQEYDLELRVQRLERRAELFEANPDRGKESVNAAVDLEVRIQQVCDLESRVERLVKRRAGLKVLALASRATELKAARKALSDELRGDVMDNVDTSLSPRTPSPLPGRPRISWTADGLVAAEPAQVPSACMTAGTAMGMLEAGTACEISTPAASTVSWKDKSTGCVARTPAIDGQQLPTQLSNQWSWSSDTAVVSVETGTSCPQMPSTAGFVMSKPEIQLHSKPVSPSSVVFRSRSPSLAMSATSVPSLSEMQTPSPYQQFERARPPALDDPLVSPPLCMAQGMGTPSTSPCRATTPTQVLSAVTSPHTNLISRPASPSLVWGSAGPRLLSPHSPQTTTSAQRACLAIHADPTFSSQPGSPVWHPRKQSSLQHPGAQQQWQWQQWQQQQQQPVREQERVREHEHERERKQQQRLRPRWVWQGTWVRQEPQGCKTEGVIVPAMAAAIEPSMKKPLSPQETSNLDGENQDNNVGMGARLVADGATAYLAAVEAGATAAAKLGQSCRAHSSAAVSGATRRDADPAEAEKDAAGAALAFLRGLPARGVPLPHEVMSCLRSAKRARALMPTRGMLLGLKEFEAAPGPPSLAEAVPLF